MTLHARGATQRSASKKALAASRANIMLRDSLMLRVDAIAFRQEEVAGVLLSALRIFDGRLHVSDVLCVLRRSSCLPGTVESQR